MAEAMGMMPNYFDQVDFLRTEKSCEFVGLFEKKEEQNPQGPQQQPLGVVCLINDGHERFMLSLLIVDERMRRQGFGEKLVRWSIGRSKGAKESPKKLWLTASQMGSPLYKRIGFETFGYSRLYKLSGQNARHHQQQQKAAGSPLRKKGTAICSFFVDDANKSTQEESLLEKALEMVASSVGSAEKTARFTSLVQTNTAHVLYEVDRDTNDVTLLAWCAVALFSLESRVIGPIFGRSAQDVSDLTVKVPQLQRETEEKHSRFLIDAKDGGTYYLHTDSQSGEEEALAKALEENGWIHERTLDLMQYDLGKEQESISAKSTSGPRQFALGDFSQG